ncbi:hypothetical protein [Pantoea sp. BAV 3049]|uniref:hypothetical protein n=1 Tax=Pantoea sp. BAV 3049 TaxID=2654188 RepID=UPI001E530928|nr:hypothetical protein [Pantoea sp. BAV 3049]
MAFIRRNKAVQQPVITAVPARQHDLLCAKAVRYLKRHGFCVAFHDRFRAWTSSGEQPDAIGFRNGASCLIEVKCSRSDFLADRNKKFRDMPSEGMGDWRFYLCEPDIIRPCDLPEGWGLLYAEGRRIVNIVGWPGNAQWLSHKPFRSNKQAECDYLYSALRRQAGKGEVDTATGTESEK